MIILWSRYPEIMNNKEWGVNVIDKVVKSSNDMQLVELSNKYLLNK